LPAPFSPSSPSTSPARIVRFTSELATTLPNRLVMPRSSMSTVSQPREPRGTRTRGPASGWPAARVARRSLFMGPAGLAAALDVDGTVDDALSERVELGLEVGGHRVLELVERCEADAARFQR